jgi:hypothetical protein
MMVLCLSAAAIGLGFGCSRATQQRVQPTRAQHGGVSIERLSRGDAASGARVGDWLLSSAPLRAVVGGSERAAEYGGAGKLLGVTVGDWRHGSLEELEVTTFVAGRALPLNVVSVQLAERADVIALRIVQRALDVDLELITDLLPRNSAIELVTRARNIGAVPLRDVAVADVARWHGRAPFAPGAGYLNPGVAAMARWVALVGERQSYGLLLPQDRSQLVFRAHPHPPTEVVAKSPLGLIGANSAIEVRRALVVASGKLHHLAEEVWRASAARLGRVHGRLDPIPPWATILVRDAAQRLIVEVEAQPDGTFDAALPAGTYSLELRTAGGRDDSTVTITAGSLTRADLIAPQPARVRYRVSGDRDERLPARVIVRGIPPTPDPVLGPGHVASGAGFVAYTASGEGELQLPPGRYAVVFEHGPEFAISEHKIEVTREQGAIVRARLGRTFETGAWKSCDFHIHAEPSPDSDISLQDRVASLLAEDIAFAVATDHNHVTSYATAIEALAADGRIASTSGVEITTTSWGHFNAFPYPLGDPPPYADITPREIFATVRARAPDALLQVNHPRMGDIGYFAVGGLFADKPEREGFSLEFDTIEVFNGFDMGHLATVEGNLAEWHRLLDAGHRHVAVGNSDSHWLLHQWVGFPRTYVEIPTASGDVTTDVVAAVRGGRVMVTNGPFVELTVEGRGLGETVSAKDGKVRVELVVRAAPWVDVRSAQLFVRGVEQQKHEPAQRTRGTGERMRWRTELAVTSDTWVTAVVRGNAAMDPVLSAVPFAFTNPIWIDADGDGVFRGRAP